MPSKKSRPLFVKLFFHLLAAGNRALFFSMGFPAGAAQMAYFLCFTALIRFLLRIIHCTAVGTRKQSMRSQKKHQV